MTFAYGTRIGGHRRWSTLFLVFLGKLYMSLVNLKQITKAMSKEEKRRRLINLNILSKSFNIIFVEMTLKGMSQY